MVRYGCLLPSDVKRAEGEIGALGRQTGGNHTPAVMTVGTGADTLRELARILQPPIRTRSNTALHTVICNRLPSRN